MTLDTITETKNLTVSKKTKFPLEPLGHAIIVRQLTSDLTAGGIHIPTKETFAYIVGEAVSVGRGHWSEEGKMIPCVIKNGDHIVFPFHRAMQITFALRKHLMDRGVTEDEIKDLCVVNEPDVVARFVEEVT